MRYFWLFSTFILYFNFQAAAFTGCLSGNCYEGYGVYIYPSGGRYEGDFERANPNGKGKLYFPNGDLYIGQWVNSYRQGTGVLFMKSGDEYEGSFYLSKFHGIGKYKYKSGAIYQGVWQMGSQHGIGVLKEADGSVYEGSFISGKMEGIGKKVFLNGMIQQGNWVNNVFVGNSKSISENGVNLKIMSETIEIPSIKALMVGISNYSDLKKLEYGDDDAQNIYDFLKSEEGGLVPSSNLILLKDEKATYRNVMQAAADLFKSAKPNDLIIFYFSGHGLPGAFLPVDSDGEYNRIAHQEIKTLLLNSSAKHKLVLADACHSGSFKGISEKENVSNLLYESLASSNGGLGLLLSSKNEEFSHEYDGIKSGVFSHFLIRGLKGEAEKNDDGLISVNELFEYVYSKVRFFTHEQQSPVFYGSIDSRMSLSIVR